VFAANFQVVAISATTCGYEGLGPLVAKVKSPSEQQLQGKLPDPRRLG